MENWNVDISPYLIFSYEEKESKRVKVSDKFFQLYSQKSNVRNVLFEEDDDFKDFLLEQKPKYLVLTLYDRKGFRVREIKFLGVEYEKVSDTEIGMNFIEFIDHYF